MAKTFKPAEVFHPGEYLRDELEARKWTQGDFAKIVGRPYQTVSEIINGKKRITAGTAKEIAAALGSSAEMWINLQSRYDLYTAGDVDPRIKKRAAQYA